MYRALFSLVVALFVLNTSSAHAIAITAGEIENFGSPCNFSVSQNGSIRTLSWGSVAGATTYKIGYRIGGTIFTLAELPGTSYEHTGWNGSDCLEYLLVACAGNGAKVCAAHVPNVGSNCSE